MPFLQWGDVPTWGLLVGAGVTALFAKRAYDTQGTELKTLQEQADDQAKQLKLQYDQLEEQRKLNERQLAVLDLQQKDLAATLDQRRSEQAALVFFWTEYLDQDPRAGQAATNMDQAGQAEPPGPVIAVYVKNTSRQPSTTSPSLSAVTRSAICAFSYPSLKRRRSTGQAANPTPRLPSNSGTQAAMPGSAMTTAASLVSTGRSN